MKLDELVDNLGRPLPQDLQNDLETAILKTISHPDSDVSAVMRRAKTIARRALDGEIRDVLHYATKALFAVSRKQRRIFEQESQYSQPPNAIVECAGYAIDGSAASIEAKILVNQILNELPKMEREVFLRYTMGWKHKKIAQELAISTAMSSYYLLRAKAHLDLVLERRSTPRGGER